MRANPYYTCMDVNAHVQEYCGHTYIHTYVHTYVHTYIRTYIHTYVHTHTYIHTYIHTYVRTYIHTYIHTYICTYIHTCTLPETLVCNHEPHAKVLAVATCDSTKFMQGSNIGQKVMHMNIITNEQHTRVHGLSNWLRPLQILQRRSLTQVVSQYHNETLNTRNISAAN